MSRPTFFHETRYVAIHEGMEPWTLNTVLYDRVESPDDAKEYIEAMDRDGAAPADEWHIYKLDIKVQVGKEMVQEWTEHAPLANLPPLENES